VVFNERHLRRLLTDYVAYYHADRTHYALRNRLREAACRLLRSDSAMRSSPANGSVWKESYESAAERSRVPRLLTTSIPRRAKG
jgi:hypothetical protein